MPTNDGIPEEGKANQDQTMTIVEDDDGEAETHASILNRLKNQEPVTRPVHVIAEEEEEKNKDGLATTSQAITTSRNMHTKNTLESTTFEIALDDQERRLFESLVETADALEKGTLLSNGETVPQKLVQIRVAGGWVRDKILGLPTHDVDIALDTCTGVEFATYFKDYMTAKQKQQQKNQNNNKISAAIGKIGVIAANPAQSKHLETATLKAFGLEVDFSNLRHETYATDSRIPTIVIGTPVEDSYRRDFTMNALYYHLQKQIVEDWTREGLHDLLSPSGQVKTPLPAYQTFHDDPLRVLRAIRFAVRYKMQLAQELMEAAMHPQIHGELHRKVSRERVGKELEGMLSGKNSNPMQALKLICNLKLAGSVFCVPPDGTIMGPIGHAHLEPVTYTASNKQEYDHLRQLAWEESRECLRVLPQVLHTMAESSTKTSTVLDSRLLHLSVTLLPYEHLQYVVKNKAKSVIEYMMREGIKIKNKDVMAMVTIVEQLDAMGQLLQTTPEVTTAARLKAGMILRSAKELWLTTMAVAAVALLRRNANSGKSSSSVDWCRRMEQWYTVIVQDLGLDKCWTVKPLMNGKEIIACLKLDKGPQVGIYNQEQIQWMLQYPNGTLEECQEYLREAQRRRELEQDQAAQHISKKMHL